MRSAIYAELPARKRIFVRRHGCDRCLPGVAPWCSGGHLAHARGTRTMSFRPKYITFDCYGTLTRFRMGELAREIFADRIPASSMDQFVKDFSAYRLDEVLGAWKPYSQVLHNAVQRTCKRWKIEFRAEEARRFYDAVPTWGPHPDVPEALARIAPHIPLVILSNASN